MKTYNSDKWDEWMRAALAGDRFSYRKLLNELHPWLCAYFGRRLNADIAQDLAQETLLALHNKRASFDLNQSFGPWISAIARYRFIDYLRKHRKVEMSAFNEDYLGAQSSHDEGIHTEMDLRKLMSILSDEQAKVIDLVKLQQLSVKEAAAATGHSESSVKVMVHRGVKKMAEHLDNIEDRET